MTRTSWVELCVSDFEQSIAWFERVLGFRVVAREADEYAELSRGETFIQLASDDAPYWETEHPHLLPTGQRGSSVEIVLLVDNIDAIYRQAQQANGSLSLWGNIVGATACPRPPVGEASARPAGGRGQAVAPTKAVSPRRMQRSQAPASNFFAR